MTLSDREIQSLHYLSRPSLIDPFDIDNLQPASVDLTLADEWLRYPSVKGADLDHMIMLKTENVTWLDKVKDNPIEMDRFTHSHCLLEPQGFVLGRTREWMNIPDDIVASVEGKSSLARLGIFVHVTAGFIDPGFSGTITLEFFNASPRYVQLVSGVRICQVAFQQLSSEAVRPYGSPGLGSKYQNQKHTGESRYQG